MKKFYVFALAAVAALVACNKDPEVQKEDDGNTTTEFKVVINEVCGVVGYKGVELYNPSDKEVSLAEVTLVKNDEDAACWTGTADDKIAAKGYFIILAKKECDEIKDITPNSTASASFSPGQTLKLVLKDKDGNDLSTFTRGTADFGTGWGTKLEAVEYSFSLTQDGGSTWKLMDITMGKTNNGAAEHGDIPVVEAA